MNKIIKLYNNKRLLFNAILSIVQVLALGGTYFILYTILLRTLGPQKLGTWSVVLSTSSVANVANIGLSSSLVRYIASYSAIKDHLKINNLIKTSAISILLFVGAVCITLYFAGYYTLSFVLPFTELEIARELLPYSLFSLWISSLGGIFLSTIDGLHSSSLRSLIYIVSALIFIIISWFLLPAFGLMGIAYAQLIQAILILIFSIFGVAYIFKGFHIFPLYWDKKTFQQIFKFSANFQIIGLCQLLYDPVTKFFLSKYGGLSFVGYYEMASRLIVQIRTLIVAANQVMIPSIARDSKNKTDKTYSITLKLVTMISLPIIVAILIFTPYISFYWIGHYEKYFIWSLIILSFSWFINILSTPSYFSSIGLGDLKGILQSHVFIAISNIVLGFLLGSHLGGIGVILSWGISLAIGSIISTWYYNKMYLPKHDKTISQSLTKSILFSIFCLIISYSLYQTKYQNIIPFKLLIYTAAIFLIYILLLSPIYWKFLKPFYLNYSKKNY